jgi:hypothetical protein
MRDFLYLQVQPLHLENAEPGRNQPIHRRQLVSVDLKQRNITNITNRIGLVGDNSLSGFRFNE